MPDTVLLPGFVDIGPQFGEPGREPAETIPSGLRAAARGGFSIVLPEPWTSPPIDTDARVRLVLHRSRGEACRLLPLAAATRDQDRLVEMALVARAGAAGVSMGDHLPESTALLRSILEYASQCGLCVVVHPSDPWLAREGIVHEGMVAERLGLPGVPSLAEEIALGVLLPLVRRTGCQVHLSRLSTAEGVDRVRRARSEGLPVTADVGFRHLVACEEDVEGFDVHHRLWPPLRGRRDREALWTGLLDGTIDAICSHHRPVSAEDKVAEFDQSPPGAVGLELLFPVLWSRRGTGPVPSFSLVQASEWLCHGPRRAMGLGAAPAAEEEGSVWDLDASWKVESARMASRSVNCPEMGMVVRGRILRLYREGRELPVPGTGSPD